MARGLVAAVFLTLLALKSTDAQLKIGEKFKDGMNFIIQNID